MSDLLIGSRRRSARGRSLAAGLVVAITAVAVSTLVYDRLVSYPTPSVSPKGGPVVAENGALRASGSSLEYAGGLRIVTLSGSPTDIGYAHGRLLRAEVEANLARRRSLLTTVNDGFLGAILAPIQHRWRLRLIDDGIPGHQLVELYALAKGARADDAFEDLVQTQAATDLGKPAPLSLGSDLGAASRTLSLVAPIHDSEGNRLVVASLRSLPGAVGNPSPPTLFVVRGDNAIPFAYVGSPGLTGVYAGINAKGLAIFVHDAHTADISTTRLAQPSALIAREILEQASTLEQATAALKAAKPLGASVFLVVDGTARKYRIVERSPTRVEIREGDRVVTDLLHSKKFVDDPENDRAVRSRPAARRAARAQSLLRALSPPSVEGLAQILRDRHDERDQQMPAGHRGTIDDPLAEFAVIFDPSRLIAWVSEGPGTSGPFRTVDLRVRLANAPITNAGPATIAAADSAHIAGSVAARASRTLLEDALALWQADREREAMEHAERALARTPQLPIALRLGSAMAEALGDDERRTELDRAFIEVADTPAAADLVGATLSGQ